MYRESCDITYIFQRFQWMLYRASHVLRDQKCWKHSGFGIHDANIFGNNGNGCIKSLDDH